MQLHKKSEISITNNSSSKITVQVHGEHNDFDFKNWMITTLVLEKPLFVNQKWSPDCLVKKFLFVFTCVSFPSIINFSVPLTKGVVGCHIMPGLLMLNLIDTSKKWITVFAIIFGWNFPLISHLNKRNLLHKYTGRNCHCGNEPLWKWLQLKLHSLQFT